MRRFLNKVFAATGIVNKNRAWHQMTQPYKLTTTDRLMYPSQPPDFVGVGVPKAGTSWWYDLLVNHPQIAQNQLEEKELSYFIHFELSGLSEHDMETYQATFASPPDMICGEWSPNYLSRPLSLQLLAESAPDTKILVMLRDPVRRTCSHVNHLLNNRAGVYRLTSRQQKQLYFLFDVFPQCLQTSLYATQIEQLFEFFPRSQVLILQYEQCVADAEREFVKTVQFLGLDLPESLPAYSKRVNETPKKQFVLDESEKNRLKQFFRPDLARLANLCPELDLELWESYR
ncbi:MAG: sulfotransferase family protein [Candidatus Promineifilaceae bacterium]